VRNKAKFLISAFALGILSTTVVCRGEENNKPSHTKEFGYASPVEVFDAYRTAHEKGDYRTEFLCLTPDSQDQTVFGCFASCLEVRGDCPKAMEALKKNGLDPALVDAEYKKAYRQRHGVIPIGIDEGGAHNDGILAPAPATRNKQPPPPPDDVILQKVVLRFVKDKAEFCEDVSKVGGDDGDSSQIEELKGLDIRNDIAVGQAVRTSDVPRLDSATGRKSEKQRVLEQFTFRRIRGRWFMEKHEVGDGRNLGHDSSATDNHNENQLPTK
jgi:hypothetical protein